MSASEAKSPGVIFTCTETPMSGVKTWRRRWRWACCAWGEEVASGIAATQAEARQKNREAKEAYLAEREVIARLNVRLKPTEISGCHQGQQQAS